MAIVMKFNNICNLLGINRNTISSYAERNNLDLYNAIAMYIPDSYINIFNELVVPESIHKDTIIIDEGIYVFGKYYKSKLDIYKDFNVNPSTIEYRINQGYSIEQALKFKETKLIEKLNNIGFDTSKINLDKINVEELNKLIIEQVKVRKEQKKIEEEQKKIEEKEQRKREEEYKKINGLVDDNIAKYFVFDKKFTTMEYLCNYYNITEGQLRGQMRFGKTLEESVKYLTDYYRYKLKDKKYKTLADIAREYNIKENTLRERLNKGYSIDEAINIPISTKRDSIKVEYNGVKYKSITEACKILGVGRSSIAKYMREGYDFQHSVDLYKQSIDSINNNRIKKQQNDKEKEQRKLAKQIEIFGITYSCIKDACKALGISDVTVRNYVRIKGLSHKEAIELLVNKKYNN